MCVLAAETVVTCPPDKPCAVFSCDPQSGQCAKTAMDAGTECDDGAPCTTAACDGAGTCAVNGNVCPCLKDEDCAAKEDGNACNGTMRCDTNSSPTACTVDPSTVVTCTQPEQPCQVANCEPKTGVCTATFAADKSTCDDGDKCTTGDHCDTGKCQPAALSCGCTSDLSCLNVDDGNVCNGVPFCNQATGKCQPNPATVITCENAANTACKALSCRPKTGKCEWDFAAITTTCDDGDSCTADEHCADGTCGDGKKVCPCTSQQDCAAKEDGDACNGTLFCDTKTNVCVVNPATVVTCPPHPNAPCRRHVCDPKVGVCKVELAAEATPCDDGVACTGGDACANGTCEPGKQALCACASNADCAKFDDGDLCNGSLYCDQSTVLSACVVNPASKVTCTDDNNTCTFLATTATLVRPGTAAKRASVRAKSGQRRRVTTTTLAPTTSARQRPAARTCQTQRRARTGTPVRPVTPAKTARA